VRRRERLLGCALTLHNADDPHDVWAPATQPDGYQSFRVLLKSAWRRERPARLWHHIRTAAAGIDDVARLSYRRVVKPAARTLIVGCRAEQAPNPESRVTLDERRDRLGMPRVRLHWQLAHQDMESFTRAQKIWAGELDRNQVDVVPFCVSGDDRWADRVAAGAHHTGTTRMHRDPQKGVVDEHCRVHGTSNLYAAGSSVFPTAGWAPPTLTIVALALRLADHCRHRLSNS
jgi:choline dehydrogenase-like flavoprotein